MLWRAPFSAQMSKLAFELRLSCVLATDKRLKENAEKLRTTPVISWMKSGRRVANVHSNVCNPDFKTSV